MHPQVLLQSVTMMGYEVIVPLLHDPQNNSTRLAPLNPPRPHAPREAIMRNIEQVLKTALQEFQAGRFQLRRRGTVPAAAELCS